MRKRTDTRLVDRSIDALMAAYLEWREACLLVEDAYRSWSRAARPGAAAAFGTFFGGA